MKAVVDMIGTLRERIALQQVTTTRDANGAAVEAFTDVYTKRIAAAVEYPATGNSEEFLGDQHISTTRVNFRIRYRKDLTAKMRVVFDGSGSDQYFDILDIIDPTPQMRRTWLVLQTEKRI